MKTANTILFAESRQARFGIETEASMAKEQKKTVHRDSKDGQFTTKKHADKNPNTTERERVRVGNSPKK